MIQLIVGNKGKGKTKHLLERANSQIKTASGNIVYLDKNTKHMHELDNKVRLINVREEQMYLDSFEELANLEGKDLEEPLKELDKISEQFKVALVISLSGSEEELPEFVKSKVIVSC